jgi:uroporphyrinogen-III synthase
MTVIVTRPEREAAHWCREFASLGLQAEPLPLIAIEPVPDARLVDAVWHQLADFKAVMFVSGNAVEHFFVRKTPAARLGWAQAAIKTRAWAPGPATRDALLAVGVPASLVDAPPAEAAQFDSRALWGEVAAQIGPGDRVMIVRGDDGGGVGQTGERDWLAGQLSDAGARAETVVAYLRRQPGFNEEQLARAQRAAADGSVWLFSSSQGIANLVRSLPGQRWHRARAIASHPRIAQAAREAGFGVVCESRPAMADLMAAIESIR